MKSEKMRISLRALTLVLLLGASFGQLVAQSQSFDMTSKSTRDDGTGYVMNSSLNEAGNLLTLKSYVTGMLVTQFKSIPADIVLVLDASGTMSQHVTKLDYKVKYVANTKYIYIIADECSSNEYYIKVDNDEYHRISGYYHYGETSTVTDEVTGQVIASAATGTDAMFPYDVYVYGEVSLDYTKAEAMVRAVSDFIDETQQDTLNHRIGLVTFGGSSGSILSQLTELTDQSVASLKAMLNSITYNGGSPADSGMEKAKEMLNSDSYGEERSGAVILFSDGEPNHGGGWTPRWAEVAIEHAKVLKDKGVQVFALNYDLYTDPEDVASAPTSKTQAMNTYLAALSSNYLSPEVIKAYDYAWNNSEHFQVNLGERSEGDFYKYANLSSASDLEEAFTEVSKSIGGAFMSLGSSSIVQAVISQYFKFPEGIVADNIKVYTDKCTSIGETGPEFSGNPDVASGITVTLNPYDSGRESHDAVQVVGFDFSDNWVGDENGQPHGNELIIEIPIELKPGVQAGLYPAIDEHGSTIYPNGDMENPLNSFQSPEVFVEGTYWYDVVSSDPGSGHIAEDNDVEYLYHIYTNQGLAWFIHIVNEGKTPTYFAKAKLEADIDMSEHFWTPLGIGRSSYMGTFDGQGHTISGLNYNSQSFEYNGMFGRISADEFDIAEIKNLVLVNCDFASSASQRMGALVGLMEGGEVSNCVVSGSLSPSGSEYNSDLKYSIVGGLVGVIKSSTYSSNSIRNCIATTQIEAVPSGTISNMQAFTVGGLVGWNGKNCLIENCFANPEIHHGGAQGSATSIFPSRYVGGIVALNNGTIENCYVRLNRGCQLSKDCSWFGMLIGFNNDYDDLQMGTIKNCYYPIEVLREINFDVYSGDEIHAIYENPEDAIAANLGEYDDITRPYTYYSYLLDNQVKMDGETDFGTIEETTLLSKLNAWVNNRTDTYSTWMRTKASDVNEDFPVLKYDNASAPDYVTVGSKDNINLEYCTGFSPIYDSLAAENTGCLFIYTTPSETITANNNGKDVKIFVDDNVALLQDESSVMSNTYTCQTIGGPDRAWHLISSSLQESPTGFKYGTTDRVEWLQSDEANPCDVTISPNAIGNYKTFFPSGATVHNIDLYNFYEPEYHWLNLKRNRLSHWHMDDHTWNIVYPSGYDLNDNRDEGSHLVPGRGYLAAIGEIPARDGDVVPQHFLLQAGGTLNNGDVEIDVTALSNYNFGSELKGYNLIGNPYQSYLDFESFANGNMDLWNESGDFARSYAVFDAGEKLYVSYLPNPSKGSKAATGMINMHQGFFIIKTGEAAKATFTNAMRSTSAEEATFRGGRPAYPLVNLKIAGSDGTGDIAVVEFGRPEFAGAEKMKNIGGDGKVYFHYEGEDYAILYLDNATDHLPVHFDAIADGTYTLTWSTANADFSYLHLIDNITGADIDMLAREGYTFTASTNDYKSRFKLMFAYTGIEENEDAESVEVFAFMHDDALIVNGEGTLEVVDMCGRTIVSTKLVGAQNTVSLPQATQGLYVLRLTNDNKVKVQKIVVR